MHIPLPQITSMSHEAGSVPLLTDAAVQPGPENPPISTNKRRRRDGCLGLRIPALSMLAHDALYISAGLFGSHSGF